MIAKKILDVLISDGVKSIAFCPYLEQMFDSMRSVYEEAVKRGLDTSLYFIPWYTKDSIGDFEITDDVEIPKQEYIVLHNPFDYYNLITSVHPYFYSDNLVKMGKKIIYIPYHTGNMEKHVIKLPVAKNAEYIFCAEGDEENIKAVYPDKKVYAFGSPKKDLLTKKHGKEVMLCASLMPLVYDPKGRIEKYKEILSMRKMLFRPHPLTESGLRAMNPAGLPLWEEFIKGIDCDRDPDLERSLSRCRKIYTDSPSILELWQETGLPYEWI